MPEQTVADDFIVREATEGDYSGVIDTLTKAFERDPVMSMAVGGSGRTETVRGLFEFQLRTLYAPQGTIDVAATSDGTILGAALWLSPEAQKGSLLADLKKLPSYYRTLGAALPRAVFTELRLLASRPRFEHWYLYVIGVSENSRGRGVGARLLDFRCERLGETPAYMEASTHRSAALYARHGFVELSRFRSGKPTLGMLYPAPVSQASLRNRHKP